MESHYSGADLFFAGGNVGWGSAQIRVAAACCLDAADSRPHPIGRISSRSLQLLLRSSIRHHRELSGAGDVTLSACTRVETCGR